MRANLVMANLAIEAGIVALTLAAILVVVFVALPRAFSSTASVALTGVAVGAAIHLGFELAGLNAAYCTIGHACQQR
ncbi:MAG: hypothetical protein KGO50_16925 [Myxococcales bacterium]|nr:hypothetical protein [Myxococcales bacterium]